MEEADNQVMKPNIIYLDMFFPNQTKGETFLQSEITYCKDPDINKYIYPAWQVNQSDEVIIGGSNEKDKTSSLFHVIRPAKPYGRICDNEVVSV